MYLYKSPSRLYQLYAICYYILAMYSIVLYWLETWFTHSAAERKVTVREMFSFSFRRFLPFRSVYLPLLLLFHSSLLILDSLPLSDYVHDIVYFNLSLESLLLLFLSFSLSFSPSHFLSLLLLLHNMNVLQIQTWNNVPFVECDKWTVHTRTTN